MTTKATSARKQLSCMLCRWQRAYSTRPNSQGTAQPNAGSRPTPGSRPNLPIYQTPIEAPGPDGPEANGFALKVLPRPIGMMDPPVPTGPDARSFGQKKDDWLSYDRNLRRRSELISQWKRPYFRDFRNLRRHDGKTFLAPSGIFREDLALYFPSLAGRTLTKGDRKVHDTTPVLRGRISVVCMFSSYWAESQVRSFVSERDNPALHEALAQHRQHETQGAQGLSQDGRAPPAPFAPQLVRVNVEENPVKAWLVRLFMGSLRKQIAREDWGRYFLVTQGLTEEIRESIGLLNSKVGYTYLVDEHCRIRWAGCGQSTPEERDRLAKGVRRLVERRADPRKRVQDSSSNTPAQA